MKKLLPLALASALLTACGQAMAPTTAALSAKGKDAAPVLKAKSGLEGAPNELVVVTRAGAKAPAVAGAHEAEAFTFRGETYHLLSSSSASTIAQAIATLKGQALQADRNTLLYATDAAKDAAPDDEFYPLQYGLTQKQVPLAWAAGFKGGTDLTVAVVDSGVDYTHPDLRERVVQGPDYAFRRGLIFNRQDKDGPMDDNGHGTHCAGIIGATANNGYGIAGVAPHVKLMAVKVMGANGSGSAYDIIKGVAYAITNGARIVNLSLGGTVTTSYERHFYEAAVASGALIVAAAGNSADAVGFPAAYPGVLSVGATDDGGQLARFSNHDRTMSLTAPGVGILSTIPGNAYAKFSGTSMAAPYVSGVAALVMSQHPELSGQEVKARLEATAADRGEPGVDSVYGHGEIDPLAALGLR